MTRYDQLAEESDQALTMIGLLLHRARMHRRMTRAQVARKAGMTVARVRELEHGVGKVGRFSDLDGIAKALDMMVQLSVPPREAVAPTAAAPPTGGES